jgi:hypothetical protein
MATRVLEGGDELRAALSRISRGVRRGGSLKVGFLAGATYPDGKPVAMIAAIHNWGAPARNIPPRPFFTNMIVKYGPGWPQLIRDQLRATNYDARETMNRVGAVLVGQLKQSIRDTNEPPLAPATIRRKGFDKPLIDRAIMINSAAHEYEER